MLYRVLGVASFFVLAMVACGGDGTQPAGPAKDAPASVDDGARYARDRRCPSCHTEDEDKPMAGVDTKLGGLDDKYQLYPPNLTPDNETGVGTWTDDQLAYAIRHGVDKDGLILCPQMKHFADMSDHEVNSIVAYLRSLAPVKHAVKRSVCPPVK